MNTPSNFLKLINSLKLKLTATPLISNKLAPSIPHFGKFNLSKIFLNICMGYMFFNFTSKYLRSKDQLNCSIWPFKKSSAIELNNIEKRAGAFQHNANDPIEDRYAAFELKNFKGYLISVLDGHGGDQLSEFANKRIFKYFDNNYLTIKSDPANSNLNEDEIIVNALYKTFDSVEREFLEEARELYNKGEGKLATVGSCATVILISSSKIYAAQLGDSKAKLYRKNKESANGYDVVKLTETHNSEKKKEQAILYKEFDDKDIVVCKRPNNKVCYVKGRLQPTRSLGDFHLKYKDFNRFYEKKYKRPIENFKGPYIKCIPDIKIFDITDKDEFIVLGSDGLWDFLGSKDVAGIVNSHKKESPNFIAEYLFYETLKKAAEESRSTVSKLMKMPAGRQKRGIHDDISIVVFDLKH